MASDSVQSGHRPHNPCDILYREVVDLAGLQVAVDDLWENRMGPPGLQFPPEQFFNPEEKLAFRLVPPGNGACKQELLTVHQSFHAGLLPRCILHHQYHEDHAEHGGGRHLPADQCDDPRQARVTQ